LETHESFSTSHAGLFLLIRALRDVRVPIIVADEKVRQLLLLKLARIWAQGIAPDAGLVFWCGYPLGLTLPEDAELDNLEAQRVFRDIVGVLIRQRVPGIDSADSESPNMSLLAGWILRAWARWIHGFAKSSTDFLLDSFVRRPGRLSILRDSIVVEIGPRPLDVVLEIAGYLDPVERVEWLSNRKVIFIRSPI
jgi:hypothetical protein